MENIVYVGANFHKINEEANYINLQTGCLYKNSYVTAEGHKMIEVGKLPFIPTFRETSSNIHGSWYECNELNVDENKEVDLSYTHWEGKIYKVNYNYNSKLSWVAAYFELNGKIVGE